MKNLNVRLVVIVLVLAASVALSYPPNEKINLGLDLKGGIHLVLQVNTEDALEAEVNQLRDRLDADLQEQGIVFTRTRVNDQYEIEILGALQDQEGQLQDYLDQLSLTWAYRTSYRGDEVDVVLEAHPRYKRELADRTVEQAKETITRRVDQYGVAEPTIAKYGSGEVQDQIIVELPGVEDFDRVIGLIKSTARLELKLVHPAASLEFPSREAAVQALAGTVPEDHEILPYREQGQLSYMVVRRAPSITGQHLKNARRAEDAFTGRSEVEFFLNAEGVRLFSRTTEQNVNRRLAIVLDDEIRSAPNIEERIDTEAARISGGFTREQAEDLALVLRSGALPAGITILENRVIGPSLGMDSIRRGIAATLLGMVLVVAGMLIVYRLSGINAILCLLLNLLILMGVLAYFGASLTLPGIAGILLTIGMAVDANILIFERVKEELRVGKTVRSAVEAGFDRVFSTILDTNLTTLAGAVVLYQFGTGPLKGFAVTLSVGLVANIFTAVFVSRTLFSLVLQRREVERLSI